MVRADKRATALAVLVPLAAGPAAAAATDGRMPIAAADPTLTTGTAVPHGQQLRFGTCAGGQEHIGFWDRADGWISWKVRVAAGATDEAMAK